MASELRRAYVLELKIGADTQEDLRHVLYQLSIEVAMGKLGAEGASGGYGSGYAYKLDIDENITHDSYFAALNECSGGCKEDGKGAANGDNNLHVE